MTMSNIESIVQVLICHGDTFHGGCPDQVAAEWDRYGFDADEVDEWCEADVWDAAAANEFRVTGMRPTDVKSVNRWLIDEHGGAGYISGCPTYSVCNGDMRIDDFVEAWKSQDN